MTRRRMGAAGAGWLSALLAAAGAAGGAQAMDPDRAMSQFVRDHWGTDRGFPGGTVHAISQTADGYLWVGTDKGLVRFDGLVFRRFPASGAASRSIVQVLGLMADGQGTLWARLGGPRLLRYRDGEAELVRSLETDEDAITAMARARDGAVLLAGIVKGALRWRNGRFEAISPGAFLPARSPVISIAEAADGRIWMGTQDEGLFYLSEGRVTPMRKGLPDPKINAVLPVGTRDVWVGTDKGIVRWNGTEITAEGLDPRLRRVAALTMLADRESNVWVGTTEGVLRVNAKGVSLLEDGEDRSRTPVTALFEDREGSLWIGTPRGIERLRDSSFTTYGRAEGLPSETSGPIHVDGKGRTWFAPSSGGLYWLRNGQPGQVRADGLPGDVVYSIAGRSAGLWVGRKSGGLTHLSFRGDSKTARTYKRDDGLVEDSVYAVHESRDGTVWAGTLGGGASRFRDGRFTTYTVEDGLASNTITSIVDGADGTTWFATPRGLSALAKGAWRVYTTRDGLPSDDVNCLLEDSAGTVWIGTGDGLAFFASGRIQVPSGSPASLREQVFGLAEDRQGWLWIATARRVLRAKRDELHERRLDHVEVAEYGLGDGLYSTEGVKRHRSVVADVFGRIWFSMSRGLSVVDPLRATSSAAPLVARIEALSADGAAIDLHAPRPIPPGPQRVTFSYSGVSLSAPDQIRFRYRLDGFDRGWSAPVSARDAVYTNLGPGSYRFRVMASNTEGLWNGAEAAALVEIAPEVWQTSWFRFTSALVLALALLGLYRLRLRRLTRQLGVRFEERLAERTRIAQELHDTLLQGFLSASMQLHVAVEQVPTDSPGRRRLAGVLELMGRVIEEGRNAVRGLRSPECGSDDLEQSFSRVRDELGTNDDVAFRVIGEGQARPLNPIIRDDVYRIGREALVNALRHSGATRIEVGVECAKHQLRVVVRDDGAGIDGEVLRAGRDGHWGLSGMRERAERIGGRLRVWSRPGAGTEVELSVPGQVAYRSPPSRGPLKWLRTLPQRWIDRIPRSRDSHRP
jgi:signal transduction histidine kinase/ligand-binding sensor domain-containing protein